MLELFITAAVSTAIVGWFFNYPSKADYFMLWIWIIVFTIGLRYFVCGSAVCDAFYWLR